MCVRAGLRAVRSRLAGRVSGAAGRLRTGVCTLWCPLAQQFRTPRCILVHLVCVCVCVLPQRFEPHSVRQHTSHLQLCLHCSNAQPRLSSLPFRPLTMYTECTPTLQPTYSCACTNPCARAPMGKLVTTQRRGLTYVMLDY